MTLKEFIQEHENDDTARLMLSRNRWPDTDIDKAVTIIEEDSAQTAWLSHASPRR